MSIDNARRTLATDRRDYSIGERNDCSGGT
jgi:hypothetical protein